jgi:hypothetical protein
MERRFIRVICGLAVVFAAGLLLKGTAEAQTPANASSVSTPRMPGGKPDLSGMWRDSIPFEVKEGTISVTTDDKGNFLQLFPSRRCTPNQKDCHADGSNQTKDYEFIDRLDPNRPLYKPEYWDKVQDLDYNTNFVDPSHKCVPLGVPRMGPPTKIVQTTNDVIFLYAGESHDFRIIPTDGRAHDPNAVPTYYGDAVGHWEGDTLVVDSVGFNDVTWIISGLQGGGGGYFHSFDMHVIERFRRKGNTLRYEVTVDDPGVLLKPWDMTPKNLVLNSNPKATIGEGLPCENVDDAITVSRIRH